MPVLLRLQKDKNNMSKLKILTIVAVVAAVAGGTYYFVAPSQKIKLTLKLIP
jgi:hypothetical protein